MNNNIEQKLIEFFEKYRLIEYKKGDVIFRPGDDFYSVSFVKDGYVRLFTQTKQGKEITINLFKPVFYLSLMFASNHKENNYFFEAITDVTLWKAPVEDVRLFLRNDPEVLEWLNDKLLKTLDEVLTNVGETTSGDSYSKVISIINSLASKFGKEDTDGITIDFQTTHRVIASLAGISRETASLQIKKMENEGLLKQQNRRIVIPDIQKLQKISSL